MNQNTYADIRTSLRHASFVGVVALWVYWWGNSLLYLSTNDARMWASRSVEVIRTGRLLPVVERTMMEGLGVWDYVYAPLVDLPVVLSILSSSSVNEPIFGATTAFALAFAGSFLAGSFGCGETERRLASLVLPFAVTMPSPLIWVWNVRFWRSAGFMIALSALVVAILVRYARRARVEDSGSRWGGVATAIALASLVWSVVVGLGLYAPIMLVPTLLIAMPAIVELLRSGAGRRLLGWAVPVTALVVAPATYASIHLQAQSAIGTREWIGSKVLQGGAEASPPWLFDLVGLNVDAYRWLLLIVWFGGAIWGSRRGRKYVLLCRSAALALCGCIVYGTVYEFGLSKGVEIGPDVEYVALAIHPVLAVLTAVVAVSIARTSRDFLAERHACELSRRFVSLSLTVPVVLWAVVWTVDNAYLRDLDRQFPASVLSDYSWLETRLGTRSDPTFRGRVLYVQPPPDGSGHPSEAVLPDRVAKELQIASLELAVPNMGVYHHQASEEYVGFMSTVFMGRRSSPRNWTVAVEVEPRLANLAGVGVVLSPRRILELETYSSEHDELELLGASLYRYVMRAPNLGDYSPTTIEVVTGFDATLGRLLDDSFDFQRSVILEAPLADQLVQASETSLEIAPSRLEVSGRSSGSSLLVLPFEFTECARVSGTGSPRLLRANGLFLAVLFTGQLDATISFRTPLTRSSCLTR